MEDTQFSDEFCGFIQSAIPAVDAAEMLLLVADRPDVWWSLAEVISRLRPGSVIPEADAARYLEGFAAAGVVETNAERRFRFKPQGGEQESFVRTLAQAYEERPVTLIRVIYALRDSKIRTFADAFKLRKK